MDLSNTLAFLVFPYLSLTVFVVGHAYRYIVDPFDWNARSSEFLEKKSAFIGITLFHWGILLTFMGHAGGLLIPQAWFDAVGIDGQRIGHRLLVGSGGRGGRLYRIDPFTEATPDVQAHSGHQTVNDYLILGGLVLATALGLFNVVFGHFYVLDTIAPWIRGIGVNPGSAVDG